MSERGDYSDSVGSLKACLEAAAQPSPRTLPHGVERAIESMFRLPEGGEIRCGCGYVYGRKEIRDVLGK